MCLKSYYASYVLLILLFVEPESSAQFRDPPPPPAKAPSWDRLHPTFYDRKLTEAQKKLLSPSAENQTTFASFLRESNTGLIRLLPAGTHEFAHTVAADQETDLVVPILGGGSYYSFTERTHKFGPWSDLRLQGDRLLASPTSLAVGILINIGDVPLDSVNIDSAGLGLIARLASPKTYSDLAELHQQARHGFQANGFEHGSVLKASPNVTYALRSMSYRKEGFLVRPDEPYTRVDVSRLGYEGSDVLIVFRILQRNDDGSVEILWKRLERFPNPKIKGEPQRHNQESVKRSIDRELAPHSGLSAVISFLDLNAISHSDYTAGYHDDEAPLGTVGLVSATIPRIERRYRAIFDLVLQFYFDDRKELIEYRMKKTRR